jgi:hypothetical protein
VDTPQKSSDHLLAFLGLLVGPSPVEDTHGL